MLEARTILKMERTEKQYRGNDYEISYSIIANGMPTHGGFQCDTVGAELIDGHYLIMKTHTVRGFEHTPVGIVGRTQTDLLNKRLYEIAKSLAAERAAQDENKVLDLTGRLPIPESERCYTRFA